MGRRRWRFVTVAAFLFFIGNIQCQDEDDFYYTPVERSFAQVQPPLFPNNRPATFFDDADSLRIASQAQQYIYNNGQLRVPTATNYNQNPSPFQVPIGRSQSGGSYYLNQPDFGSVQKHRLRPALPHNYQFISTTKKPDVSQIHSSAYQNDPSRPETFLGQITINNPDVDYLQNNRFKNVPFDSNSLKLNSQNGHIPRDQEFDTDELDLFDQHKVTTFNPNKLVYKQSQYSPKPNGARFSHFSSLTEPKKNNLPNPTSKINIPAKQVNNPLASINTRYQSSSTEYKSLLELEPLLEDDLSDSSLKELMKNPKESGDVQIIKSSNGNITETSEDSKPDASSMNADNIPNDTPNHITELKETKETHSPPEHLETEDIGENDSIDDTNQSNEDDTEYVEYYDDESNNTTVAPHSTERATDIYDEYDASEEPDQHMDYKESNTTEAFDVLLTKSNNTMVKDDNFKHFVDTTVIDQPEPLDYNKTDITTDAPLPIKYPIIDIPSILGEEVVSVVTTKSVVNGTISIPHNTYAPTERVRSSTEPSRDILMFQNNETIPVTTDNWVVVASVQTSRSISGARFLPFPTVEQEEKKQVLTEDDEEEDPEQNIKSNVKDRKFDTTNLVNSSSSTENINDKLDSIQSELSSAVFSGNIDNDNKNIELIPESAFENNSSANIETTTNLLNLFTLKSTQGLPLTELSSPGPLPVTIKKFMPRIPSFTTPKPKRKPSIVTVADNLDGLLPAGFKQPSYKNKRTSTSTSTTTTTTSTSIPITTTEEHTINASQARSIGLSMKNKVILLDDKSLLPKEYIPKDSKTPNVNVKKLKDDDINNFLPPGYKEPVLEAPETDTASLPNIKDKIKEVDISAFLPKDYNLSISSTEKPKSKLIDKISEVDVSSFLPKDYKIAISSTEKSKKKTNALDSIQEVDVSAFLPKGFNLSTVTTEKSESKPKLFKKIQEVDISAFLPKDHNANRTTTEKVKSKFDTNNNVKDVDITAFLPKDYNTGPKSTPNTKIEEKVPKNILPVDITAFLPPGFKLNNTQEEKIDNINFKVADVTNLLPPELESNESVSPASSVTTKAPGGIKLLFPTRPGGKTLRKTTPKPGGMGPSPVTPKIQKGWPTRASTEFTGWPSPPTTPLSIEKLLEALANEKVGGSNSPKTGWSPETEITTQAMTTTTTTSTTPPPPPPPTTPGICVRECEIAATIKIVEGVKWIPELQDPHTEEWQNLAREIKDELNSVYSKSDLRKWFKTIHIDSFSKGSVLVDYFIELNNVEEKLNTLELKKRFHQSLTQIKSEPAFKEEEPLEGSLDSDVMLGDQPDEDKMKKSNERMSKTFEKATPKLEMGKFIMDPAYTEFIVVQKHEEPKEEVSEEESVLPQWGIAVIVIAMASLLFVVIFGVTVLVNRQKNTKLKQPIPLSEDMLRELDKNHMGGFEDNHQLKERDLPYLPTGKRMSTAFIEQLAYPNPGDSWRSEWTPQMQKYMQNYATDSGRGTQLYGAAGNIYGYGGSQLYGHTGGGSQIYGYTGEYPRSHHSRRRSEYDSNF